MCEIQTTPFNAELLSLNVCELMAMPLAIPDYQRSFTWCSSHVSDLLKDITNRNRSYLLGTIILHNHDEQFDIVDGQQRLVTLTILIKVLGADIRMPLLNSDARFSNNAAEAIKNTKTVITDFLTSVGDVRKLELKQWLEAGSLFFAVLTLKGETALALDRAYTFFDSVNSKGKPLSDFDLLKAHHLMFIPSNQEDLAELHNSEWQSRDEAHTRVFTSCLRRLRMWAKRHVRDNKGQRPDYYEFVSVTEPDVLKNRTEYHLTRYMQPAVFRSWRRDGTRIVLSMDYPSHADEDLIPTEVTQTIEGGDPFFVYAKRYHMLYERLFTPKEIVVSPAIKFARELTEHVANPYLHDALCAALLLYVDKFGEDQLPDVATCLERLISAKRWEGKSVRIEGVLSHVQRVEIIPILLNATNAHHVLVTLLAKCQTASRPSQQRTQVQARYFDRLQHFHRKATSNIMDGRVQTMIKGIYAF